jgi:hypothetical protein
MVKAIQGLFCEHIEKYEFHKLYDLKVLEVRTSFRKIRMVN